MRANFGTVAALLLAAGCSGPYSGLTTSAKDAAKPLLVRVHTVSIQSLPETVTATGELFAEEQATISAKVPGRVAQLKVDLGSRVEAGDVLAELEKTDYEFRVRQVEALVEQTRARLGLGPDDGDDIDPAKTATVKIGFGALDAARLDFTRISGLTKEGILSQADYDRARSALLLAEARYQASIEEIYQTKAQLVERRAQLDLARQQLADTVIRAPFRGAVTRRPASLGEFLAMNAPVVVLVRSHPLRLRLEVPERLAGKIHLGQRVEVRVEGAGGAVRSGAVVRLSPALEAQNRSLLVEGEIPNPDNALRAGSFAEGTITVNPDARGLALPTRAVLSYAGVERVFVVESGAARERVVRTGRRLPADRVEILQGLGPGDAVITDGHDRVVSGQKVQISGT